jgi:hypothetical protein
MEYDGKTINAFRILTKKPAFEYNKYSKAG